MKKKKQKLSLKLTLVMGAIVAGAVLLCWLLNTTFLKNYYIRNKEKAILETYNSVCTAAASGDISTNDFMIRLERYCNNSNLNVMVIDAEKGILLSSGGNSELFQMQLNDIQFGVDQGNVKILKEADNYRIEQRTDNRMNSDYIELLGNLDDGGIVFIRTALEGIEESARLTTQFFGLIGIITIVGAAIVIVFVSRGISRPIKELTDISKRMKNLDFDAKYESSRAASLEIDELGHHMNEMSDTLEQTIGELKSANAQLTQDIKEKEEIDEMRKEFLSNVSHELKTPLALISGYAEGLAEGINDDDAESRNYYCEVILDESQKMDRMVKQLINLNQLEFGKTTVEMSRFDLGDLVDSVIGRSKLLAEQAGVTILHERTGEETVWADMFQTEQVVTNFLTNAIHYALNEKQVRMTYEQKGDLLRLSVFNTGNPIPEEEIDRIWEKFYKVDKARTREYGGSGIGLSIVKAIMDSFHRECGVINHPDGVEFWAEFSRK